jgi:hypothetical protein
MMADGRITETTKSHIMKSARVVATDNSQPKIMLDGKEIDSTEVSELKFYEAKAGDVGLTQTTTYVKGNVYIAAWKHPVAATTTITIKPDSFPGTYYVTGDTMIRSERTGKDEYFQFVIPKAKMTAEQTISLEAEGDPSTFNMTLQVLRPESGEMLQFIKYEFISESSNKSGDGFIDSESAVNN